MDGREDSSSLLDSLGRASLRDFDAFPKVAASYRTRSSGGGLTTIGVTLLVMGLVWGELREFLFGEPKMSFSVDHRLGHALQINVDITVAMPCHFLTVDVRDAVGDRLHISDELTKDGTTFEIGQAHRLQSIKYGTSLSASRMIRDSRGKAAFGRTAHLVQDGPACRIYGPLLVKKVTGNLVRMWACCDDWCGCERSGTYGDSAEGADSWPAHYEPRTWLRARFSPVS